MALLNITPEGQLQTETKDIIEELQIMIHITKKQKEVLKRFKRHAENLLNSNWDFLETFRTNADRLLEETDERQGELEELHRNAEHVCKDVSILSPRF